MSVLLTRSRTRLERTFAMIVLLAMARTMTNKTTVWLGLPVPLLPSQPTPLEDQQASLLEVPLAAQLDDLLAGLQASLLATLQASLPPRLPCTSLRISCARATLSAQLELTAMFLP